MPLRKLFLFGAPRLESAGHAVPLSGRKQIALLAYVAVTGQPQRRDTVATLLWPEFDQTTARANLRRELSLLKRLLGDDVLTIDREQLSLGQGLQFWLDVAAFRARCQESQRHVHPPNAPCPFCLSLLQEAADLYTADFLAGFTLADSPAFDEWQFFQTEQLRQALAGVLARLVQGQQAQQTLADAIGYARRWLTLDPLQEAVHRTLMDLYVQTGQRAAALRQYEECKQLLKAELGIAPAPETITLYQRIKMPVGLAPQPLHPPNQVVASDPGLHTLEPRPPAAPLPAFLNGQTSVAPAKPVFVARRQQLTQLHQCFKRTVAGQGQVVFVTGEAGSGKTALLAEFAHQAQTAAPDLIVAQGVCNAYTGVGDPYLPFRDLLAMLTGDVEAHWQAGALPHEQAVRLWRLLPVAVTALLDHGPNLLDTFVATTALLNRAAPYRASGADWLTRLEAHRQQASQQRPDQNRVFEEFAQFLHVLAADHPLLLLLDDLHWADTSSVALLFYLGRRLAHCRILIVGAYRPEDVAQPWSATPHPLVEVSEEFKRQAGNAQVRLDELPAEGRHFVDALLDVAPNRLDESFRQAIFRQSGGHALFTTELLRDLQERGELLQDHAGYWVVGARLDWQFLPARVEGVIARRMSRLDLRLRELLTVASVEGEEFTAEVVARSQGLDERQLVQWLSNELDRRYLLVRAQELRQVGQRRLSRYRFRHNLFQTYLYGTLSPAERAYLHEAVALALEQLYGEQESERALIAAQLAHHFEEAGRLEKAIDYRLLAGQAAVKVAANQEAIVHYQAGLALLQILPDTADRAQRELTLQIALGMPVTASKGYGHSAVEPIYTRAYELSVQLGATTQLFPTLYGLWRMAVMRGDLQSGQRLGEQIMAIAQQAQQLELLVEAYRAVGLNAFHLGDFPTARALCEQGLTYYERQQHRYHVSLYGHDPAVSCLGYWSHTCWLLGYPDQAIQRRQEVLHLAYDLAHPFSLGHALVWDAALLNQLLGDVSGVQTSAQTGIELAMEHKFPHWENLATILAGWALAAQGQFTVGLGMMHQGLTNWRAAGANTMVAYFLALLAEIHLQLGAIEPGLACITEALALIAQTGEGFYAAEIHRLHGELLLAAGRSATEVEAHLQQSLVIAQQQTAKSLELRTTMSLCRLWQQQGKHHEAQEMLAAIYGWFTEGFATRDLMSARSLLMELTSRTARSR